MRVDAHCKVCGSACVLLPGWDYCAKHLPPGRPPLLQLNALPVQDLEAEQSVIGWAFLDTATLALVGRVVRAADFYSDAYRAAYRALWARYRGAKDTDLLSVLSALKRHDNKPKWSTILVDAVGDAGPRSHLCWYADRIAEAARARREVEQAIKAIEAVYSIHGTV